MILMQPPLSFYTADPLLYSGRLAQSDPVENPRRPAVHANRQLVIKPARADGLGLLVRATLLLWEDAALLPASSLRAISLTCPTARRCAFALDQRTRVDHSRRDGSRQSRRNVYAFDRPVIPSGSIVSGRIISISPVSGVKRTLAYANGNFFPSTNTRSHLRCSLCSPGVRTSAVSMNRSLYRNCRTLEQSEHLKCDLVLWKGEKLPLAKASVRFTPDTGLMLMIRPLTILRMELRAGSKA